jgi:long-chain fatty acid transport protein
MSLPTRITTPLPAAALALSCAGAAGATGNFSLGYGLKYSAVAGAGIAFPQDSLAMVTKPARVVFVVDTLDRGVHVLLPRRAATLIPLGRPAYGFDGNRTSTFYIPPTGWGRHLTHDLAVGVPIYGDDGFAPAMRPTRSAAFTRRALPASISRSCS